MGSCGNASLCDSWHAYVYGNSTFYPRYQADPDISGTGVSVWLPRLETRLTGKVIIAFIATGAILLCLLSLHNILHARESAQTNLVDQWVYTALGLLPLGLAVSPQAGQFWDPIITTLVLSLSDQMLLTGLSMLMAAYTLHCTMSVYHAGIVLDLAWFASVAHLLTLGHIHRKMQGRDRLRNSRVILMVLMAILLLINTFFLGHWATFISGPFNAQCLWDDMRQKGNVFGGEPLPVMTTNLVLILALYTIAVIQFYPHLSAYFEQCLFTRPQRFLQAWRSRVSNMPHRGKETHSMIRALIFIAEKWHFLCTEFIRTLLTSMSVSFVVNLACFVWGVKNIFVDREAPHRERHRFSDIPMEGNENRMGFGQIVPILLLTSTVLTAIEAYEGRMKDPPIFKGTLCLLTQRTKSGVEASKYSGCRRAYYREGTVHHFQSHRS